MFVHFLNKANVLVGEALGFLVRQGLQQAIHFTLDGQAVFVYAPDTKDDLITLRQLFYDFLTYFAKYFAFVHTGEVVE